MFYLTSEFGLQRPFDDNVLANIILQEDYKEALKYFEKAAAMGDYQAMFQAAVVHYDALSGEKDEV